MKRVIFVIISFVTYCVAVEFSDRARNFSIELLYHTQLETDGHVVISPFGIWSLMTGVTLGASGDSEKQLKRALLLPNNPYTIRNGYSNLTKTVLNPNTEVTLKNKNFIFLDKGFIISEDFSRKLKTNFGATVENLDFQNSASAANKSNMLIEEFDPTLSNVLSASDFIQSRMILTNVITFKGLWSSPFNTTDTLLEPFYDENKKKIGEVNMMYQQAPLPFGRMDEMKAHVLQLPYGNDGKYCMLIVLPYPKVKVTDVYSTLTTVSFADIFKKLDFNVKYFDSEDVEVKLPRFKISTNVILNKPLNEMGVNDIFDPSKANFEKISREELYISAIVHKADIEVTESGTSASASTSAIFVSRISTPKFEANRPFIYFVMERPTATVIFGGIYSKPSVF